MKHRLVDRAEFTVTAGRGGHGSIHFRREKYISKGGPDGGDGGRGGDIVLRASKHLATLRYFSGKDRFEANNGRPGGKRQRGGEDAEGRVIEVPVGTVVMIKQDQSRLLKGRKLYGEDVERMVSSGYKVDRVDYLDFEERWNLENDKQDHQSQKSKFESQKHKSKVKSEKQGSRFKIQESGWIQVADLDSHGSEVIVAQGGRGGLGNTTYKSSKNTTPKVAQRGELGERFEVRLELKVLADVGLVGLPNAGKSTLLSVLTAAKPEIADYPFTTLSPNLGVMEARSKKQEARSIIVADIPGLIEDAHKGKGLGVDFLRHVERCSELMYVVAPMESDLITSKGDPSTAKRRTGVRRAQDDELDYESLSSSSNEDLGQKLWEQYQTVRKEVESYGGGLAEKPFMVVINKLDLIQDSRVKIQEWFKKKGVEVVLVSAATTEGVGELKQKISE